MRLLKVWNITHLWFDKIVNWGVCWDICQLVLISVGIHANDREGFCLAAAGGENICNSGLLKNMFTYDVGRDM